MKKIYVASLTLIMIFAMSPFFAAGLGSIIGNAASCTLNEAEVHRCIIYGHDYGQTLYEMGMSIWFMIFTVPLAEFAFVVWAITLITHLMTRRRRKDRNEWPV